MNKFSALLFLTIIAVAAAEYGYYIPKSFYKIDPNGHQSETYFIEVPVEAVHPRFRRSPQFQPIFPNPNLPGFGQQPGFGQNFGAFPGGQSSGISTSTFTTTGSNNLASRFGEDEPQTVGQTTTFHSQNGQFTQTTHNIGPDGKVQTTVQKGRHH